MRNSSENLSKENSFGITTKIIVDGPYVDDRKVYWDDGDGSGLLERIEAETLCDPRRRIVGIRVIDHSILDLDSLNRQRLQESPITAEAKLLPAE